MKITHKSPHMIVSVMQGHIYYLSKYIRLLIGENLFFDKKIFILSERIYYISTARNYGTEKQLFN